VIIMQIHSLSSFKNPTEATRFFENWVRQLETLNKTSYERMDIQTSLGNTVVWGINTDKTDAKTVVIFPGFRTCSMFWDLDNALAPLKEHYRIFLVDTNGQPCLSDGNTPDIKSNDYGVWAAEVLHKLSLQKAVVAGASFGGLVCLKLCLVAPELVEKAVLLNPGCLQAFSLAPKNLYYNMLPIFFPSAKNVETFLDNAVFYKNKHTLSPAAKKLIVDFEVYALTQFRDKAQKPYPMSKEDLEAVKPDVYLILGDKDRLFPYQKSLDVARAHIKTLRGSFVVPDTGHGIETSQEALQILADIVAQ
jgi:pimeloyl-ACP methyl ester carboxylesterase